MLVDVLVDVLVVVLSVVLDIVVVDDDLEVGLKVEVTVLVTVVPWPETMEVMVTVDEADPDPACMSVPVDEAELENINSIGWWAGSRTLRLTRRFSPLCFDFLTPLQQWRPQRSG